MRKKSFLFIILCWLLAAAGAGYLLFFKQEADGVMLDVSAPSTPTEDEATPAQQPITASTTLEGAHFTGKTANGTQWSIFAQNAQTQGTQESGNTQTSIQLEALTATLISNKAQNIHFKARHGTYNTGEESLTLSQNVSVNGQGLTLKTEELHARMKNQTLNSQTPTSLNGTFGTWDIFLQGNTLAATFTGEAPHVTLRGKVHASLTPMPTTDNTQRKN